MADREEGAFLVSAVVSPENVRAIHDAYARREITGAFQPAVFVVEPTSACNVQCIMCPNSRLASGNIGYMSVSQWQRVMMAIAPTAELVMLYFMGEPTLHPEFRDLTTIAREHISGRLVLSTNATLLSADVVRAIVDANLDVVIICIDRWDREFYERIRRGASFDAVVAGARALLRARPTDMRVIIKALDFRMPEDERQAFTGYWRALGGTPIVGWIDTWAGQMPQLRRLTDVAAPYEHQARVPCADLWFKMVINWRGEVVLCCHNYDYSVTIGTIDSPSDVARAWHGATIQSFRAAHRRGAYTTPSICEKCREWGAIQELDAYIACRDEQLSLVF